MKRKTANGADADLVEPNIPRASGGSAAATATRPTRVDMVATADLPTRFGHFKIVGFREIGTEKEHTAILHGDVVSGEDIPVRIHSQCHTGDVLGSLRCDCRDQLEAGLDYISKQDMGILIYLAQEGRGIGLVNKIRAYHLQDMGFDTVDANEHLGFPSDARDYGVAASIIETLEVQSVAVLTNNPDKISGLEAYGVRVTRRIPLVAESNVYNESYLSTKRERMGHLY